MTDIEWAEADALPFPLCISSRTDPQHGDIALDAVSVALGNIVLADNGLTVNQEPLGSVPPITMNRVIAGNEDHCKPSAPIPVWPRFYPELKQGPLTQAATVSKIDPRTGQLQFQSVDLNAPAAAAFQWQMRDVLPFVRLQDNENRLWLPRRDLLESDRFANEFVAEIEDDGRGVLRFGDDQHGLRPSSGLSFSANYRIGNGAQGNIGAESLGHIVTTDVKIDRVINPLPASGGIEPESIEDVRHRAPSAFRTQERAITAEDYARVALLHPQVKRAAATFRWTGSWRTVFLTIERVGLLPVDEPFRELIIGHLERYRMAGQDVDVNGPKFVSLEIELFVCVQPDYFRSDVKAALLAVFSNRILPNGTRGVFHIDNFGFGQPVYLSRIQSAAQSVPGVSSVDVIVFQRQGSPDTDGRQDGKLPMGRLEIGRLDNDPNFPEHGVFRLNLSGGK